MDEDEWGRDPTVAGMRSVFAAVEAAQNRFLDGLGVSRLDKRLRQWRKMALHLFERSWAVSARRGMPLTEKDAADLYLYCIAKVLGTRGIEAPRLSLPDNPAVRRLLRKQGEFAGTASPFRPLSHLSRSGESRAAGSRPNRLGCMVPHYRPRHAAAIEGRGAPAQDAGWWTVEPDDVSALVRRYGRPVVGEQGELMVECADDETMEALARALFEKFGEQVHLAP